MGPVQPQPFSAVDIVDGVGRIVYLRSAQTEPSGGNQLYWYQNTGVSTAVTYIPSPGAISVAETNNGSFSRNSLMIVDAQHDVYYESGSGSGWTLLNSGGIKFSKIVTRDFTMSLVTPNGLLFGIGTDNRIYRFNINTISWNLTSSTQLAYDITVDDSGHPWIIGPFHANYGNIYRAGGYGQAFGPWVPYRGYGTKITSTFGVQGIAIAGPDPERNAGGGLSSPSTCILWSPLPGATPVTNFQVAYSFPDAYSNPAAMVTPIITGLSCLKSDNLWITAVFPNGNSVLYAADFTGI
jgi:hypothetical protein